jgi:hypothetical protein
MSNEGTPGQMQTEIPTGIFSDGMENGQQTRPLQFLNEATRSEKEHIANIEQIWYKGSNSSRI